LGTQHRFWRFSGSEWVFGKFVAEIFECEFKPIGEPSRIFEGMREISKKMLHFRGSFEKTLVIL